MKKSLEFSVVVNKNDKSATWKYYSVWEYEISKLSFTTY